MQVDLQIEGIQETMSMWREALDMQIPLRDEFKIHFMVRRQAILKNFAQVAQAWNHMLGYMTVLPEQQADFDHIKNDVTNFTTWANTELAKLKELSHDS